MAIETCQLAVVGAGPYGLATAAHLRRVGVDVRSFGRSMEFWERSMPTGMVLRSAWEASHIADPDERLSLDVYEEVESVRLSRPIPLADFVRYGHWYQREAVPEVDERAVDRIERVPGGLRLTLSDGDQLRARRVIVATGLDSFAWWPEEFRQLPSEVVSHSSDHNDLGRFAGRRVAVVGGGQSAVESAALLSEGGAEVELIVRAPLVRWLPYARAHRLPPLARALIYPPTDVGPPPLNWMVAIPELFRLLPKDLQQRVAYRCIRPAAADWLRNRVQDVHFTIGRRVLEATPSGPGVRVRLSDGGERVVDHVLLATGYRVDVARLPFLDGELAGALAVKDGYPRLSRGFESSVPGLHFVGAPAAATFGPIMRFVVGTVYAACAVQLRVLEERPPGVAQTVRAYARRRERMAPRRPRAMTSGEDGSAGRVLVTEGENRGVLAACRSLSQAGYEVTAVAGRRAAAALWSRACHSSLVLTDPSESPVRFVADLEAVARRDAFDALLAGGDRSLLSISDARESLGRHVELGLPDREAVEQSVDKLALLAAAAAAGLDSPPSRVCESTSDARRALRHLGFPSVVKPRRSVVESAGSLRQQPVALVTHPSELDQLSARVSLPFIVQRFESQAKRLSCAGVMGAKGVLGLVVIEFLRTWPPLAGAVSFGETVRAPGGLRERVEQLLDFVGWRGIFELELLDVGRGRLAAIDLNPRVFGWLALAITAGADLPRIWMESLAGVDSRPVEPRVGVRYRWEDAELAHLLWQVRRGRLGAAAHVIWPRRHVVHAHFSLADPAPLAARLLGLAQHRTRVGWHARSRLRKTRISSRL